MAADAILIFEEFECCIRSRMRFIELKDAELAVFKSAAVFGQLMVEISLRNRKDRSPLGFCLFDSRYLFFQGGKQ